MAYRTRLWSPLDNAAKIFPSSCQKSDTRVFRFSAELTEDIDENILQSAVDKTAIEYPHFLSVLRRGFFWYYLDSTNLRSIVSKESTSPCSQIYIEGKQSLLFRVTYFKKRINFEVFHVLSDGVGAIQFFKSIVASYLILKYPDSFPNSKLEVTDDSSAFEKSNDSFDTYYQEEKGKFHQSYKKRSRAFKPKYFRRDDDDLGFIECDVSLNDVKALAKKYNTTITVFLIAVYMIAISKEMKVRHKKNPVTIGVPVNLRKFFKTSTVKNFFVMNYVEYDFSKSDLLEDVIKKVATDFSKVLEEESIRKTINSLCHLEHRFWIRIAPLFLKDIVLRNSCKQSEKHTTSLVSNIGSISMSNEFLPFINHFTFFSSTLTFELTACSFKNVLSLGYSNAFKNTQIIRNFLSLLNSMGIKITLYSNDFESLEKEGTK